MARPAPAASAELTSLVNTAHLGLESLAKLIGKQAQDFPQEDIENWKEKIRNLSRSSAVLANEATITKDVIDSEMGRLREKRKNRSDADDVSETTAAAAIEEIKRLVKARSSSFKPDSAPFMKKISDILKKVGKNDDDDDEDIVVDDELQENNFKCPVTTMRIEEPMTKYVKLCRSFLFPIV
jgi:hypothetical protein